MPEFVIRCWVEADHNSLWGAPYLYAQTWAMPVLNLSLQDSTDLSMNYYAAGPLLANITGLQG